MSMELFTLPRNTLGDSVTFTGKLLGEITSRRSTRQPRWLEMRVYLTEGGRYVLHKIGESRVVHDGKAPCREEYRSHDVAAFDPALHSLDRNCGCSTRVTVGSDVLLEHPYYSIAEATTPQALVGVCKTNRGGEMVLSYTAQELLEVIGYEIPEVRDALRNTVIH